jgi:hypothetical protein
MVMFAEMIDEKRSRRAQSRDNQDPKPAARKTQSLQSHERGTGTFRAPSEIAIVSVRL